MAVSRIKGITIEINGDVTKLNDSLKEVNKSLSETSRGLKDVDRLLKLDPSNTELLRQKQEYLAQAIENTKEKLEKEKEALEQMKNADGFDKNSEQARALERQIIADEEALKSFEKQAKDLPSSFKVSCEQISKKLETVGKKTVDVGKKLTKYVTVPLVGAGTVGVKKFADVDKTMQLTNKTMGNTAEQAEMLNHAMKDAAANSTFGMTDAATATLNFARAGLDAEQAAAALAPAMNLAAGEGGDLDTVSAGLVATINGFHGSFEDAEKYADVFAAACNNSALDVDSLSNAMSVAAPIFSAAGYSVNDAALYMGTMANNGIDADKAANSLKTGLARLVSPAKSGAEMMKKLGISVTNADGSMKDSVTVQKELHDAFSRLSESEQIAAASAIFGKNQMAPWLALINTAPKDVRTLDASLAGAGMTIDSFAEQLSKNGFSLDDMKEKLAKLGISSDTVDEALKTSGGSAEQFAYSLGLASGDTENTDEILKYLGVTLDDLQTSMDGAKGTTQEMADAMMNGFGGSLEKLKSSIDVAATSLGEALAPTILKVANFIQSLMDKFNALDPQQQQMIATIGLVVAAIGPVLVIVGTLLGVISKVILGIGVVSTVIGAPFLVPLGIAVAAIAAIIAIGVVLYKNWDKIKETAQKLAEGLKQKWRQIQDDVGRAARFLSQDVPAKFKGLRDDVISDINELKDGAKRKFDELKDGAVQKAADLKDGAVQKIEDLRDGALQGVEDLRNRAVQGIEDLRNGAVQKAEELRTGAIEKFQALKDGFDEKLGGIGDRAKEVFDSVRSFIEDPVSAARDFVGNAVEDIKGFFNFDWHLPELKLPHIVVGGYIDVPVLGRIPDPDQIYVDWYDKAMNAPMLLKGATIFGAMGKNLLGGGESGAEVVSGLDTLLDMIMQAVQRVMQPIMQSIMQTSNIINNYSININVYAREGQNLHELARIVKDDLKHELEREGAVFA